MSVPASVQDNSNPFEGLDIPEHWATVLQKLNINNADQLKAANLNKLFNDMNGLRKKMKLDVAALKMEDLQAWTK